MNDRFFKVVVENGEETITQITAKEVSEARNIEYVHVITADNFLGFDNVESISVTDSTVEIQGTKFERSDIEDLSLYEYR